MPRVSGRCHPRHNCLVARIPFCAGDFRSRRRAASGLGRAFFYAGTRALLVTNWSVHSQSARQLITDLFQRQADDSTLGRSEALRQAMMALLDGPGYLGSEGRSAVLGAVYHCWRRRRAAIGRWREGLSGELTRQVRNKMWVGTFAVSLLIPRVAHAAQLITEEEARLPPPKGAIAADRRGILRGPRVEVVSPGETVHSPLRLQLKFEVFAYRDRYSRQGSNPSRALDRVARSDRARREYPARLRVWQHSSDPDLPCIAAGAGARRQAQRVCVSYRTAARSTRRRGAATASRASSRT